MTDSRHLIELTIQQQLRMRARATPAPDNLLDDQAAALIEQLLVRIDTLEMALFHLDRKLSQFSRAIARESLPPAVRELVALMLRSTPSMSEAEAIKIVEKAAAKVFNEEYESWPQSKPPDH